MPSPSTTDPSERFRSIFDKALKAYTKKTEKNLLSLPLFRDLDACDSPEEILSKLRDPKLGFNQLGSNDGLKKWLTPIVNVLYAFSATLGEGVGLVFSPGKVVFAGVGILLLAAKDVAASQDKVVDVFRRVGSFLGRLETYTHIPLSDEMTDVIVNIMAEVLSILAIATRDIKQGMGKKFVKRLIGKTDIEDALGRLDKLTQDEVWMAVAQNLKITHCVDNRVRVVDEKVDRVLDADEHRGAMLQQIASDVGDKNRNDLRQKLRQWLSPPDPSVNYNTACSLHYTGTAEWFTEGPVFVDWKKSGSLLWVYGNPGSGKSVLSSAIIRNIKCIANTGSAHLAYFFLDFKDTGKQESRGLLSSILHQLCEQSLACLDILSRLYSTHHHGSEQPSDDTLRQCLKDMLTIAGQVPIYLVVDALDESPDTHGVPSSREKVLDLVQELVKFQRPNLRLCVTSRDEIDIRTVLQPLAPTSLSLHDQKGQNEDIVDYVTSIISSDPGLIKRGWREEDKELVITTLSRRAGGMFRWVHCQVEILRRCFARNLQRTLDELPKTLDATYERILREIPEQNRDDAHRLLQCLTVAARPLRVEELAEVLAVDFTSGKIPKLNVDSRLVDQEQAVLLACSSLIAIVQEYDRERRPSSRLVQFSHFSVKEFLTSERPAGDISHYRIRSEPAHTVMAQACLAALFQLDYSLSMQTRKNFPLAEYAAENFSRHAEFEKVLTQIPDAVDYLLDAEKPHFAAWIWALNTQFGRDGRERPQRPQTVPLYYVAKFGFCRLVQHILSKRPQDVNAQSGDCGTALHVAMVKGHAEVSKLLFAHCVDVDVRGAKGRTLLHLASEKGYVDIVQQLLHRNADVHAQDDNHSTPLHLASSQSNLEVAKLLVECGANVRVRNNKGKTPLHLASERGYVDTMRLLLDRGADVHALDYDHWTPLHLASDVEAAKLLVECGANVQVRNSEGGTPLHLASEYGDVDTMRLLLDRGVNVDTLDDDDETPLHRAWDVEAANLLVERGANIQVRNNNGQTPLHLASEYGYVDTMRLLLDRGADVDAQDDDGLTPLNIVSSSSEGDWSARAVKLLVERGANIQVRNDNGQTPLHLASEYGCVDTMRLLLDRGADAVAQDDHGWTPLDSVSLEKKSCAEAMKLLFERANIPVRDKVGQTLRHFALEFGDVDTIQLLLDRGANRDAQDDDHSIPLHLAFSTHLDDNALANLVVECGANVQVRNNEGKTLLHLASEYERVDTMRLLLGRGADVHALDDNHSTPLHLASCIEAAELLVECGANVGARNNEGKTPLHLASKYEYVDTMRLLLGRGADVHALDDNHLTPLHDLASSWWNAEAMKLLVECGANVGVRNNNGKTPLHLASERGDHDTIRLLLDRGADVDAQDDNRSTPLHLASSQRKVEAAKVLVEYDANVQVRNSNGQTPLHLASKGGYHDIMRLLLDRGADVDAQDDNRSTPLHLALSRQEVEAANVLVECGANIRVQNNNGQTPLHLASKGGCHNIMRLLLDRGADVDAQDDNRSTPLHLASSRQEVEAANVLVECGANIRVQNNNGQTPLHLASKGGSHDIIWLLLDRGADVHALDDNHSTPLHLVVCQWGVEAADLLVERGADIQVRDNKGQTPLHLASKGGYHGTMRLLLDRGAEIHARDDNRSTPLHLASSSRWEVEAVDLLVKYGANVQVRNNNGQTPLHLASEIGNDYAMQLLLDQGADVHAQDDHRSTPLHLASSQSNVGAVRLLLQQTPKIDIRDKEGNTPLQVASARGHEGVMRLLEDYVSSGSKM